MAKNNAEVKRFVYLGRSLDDVLCFEDIKIPSIALVTREGVKYKITL